MEQKREVFYMYISALEVKSVKTQFLFFYQVVEVRATI